MFELKIINTINKYLAKGPFCSLELFEIDAQHTLQVSHQRTKKTPKNKKHGGRGR